MTIEEERAALRLQMIADAEADILKNFNPNDPDIEFQRGLAKEMAVDLVDTVIAHGKRERDARIPDPGEPTMTPADWSAAVRRRLEEIGGTGLPEYEAAGMYDPATGKMETTVSQRMGIVVRQVGDK